VQRRPAASPARLHRHPCRPVPRPGSVGGARRPPRARCPRRWRTETGAVGA